MAASVNPADSRALMSRLRDLTLAWRVTAERVVHTATAVLAFGQRDRQPVVLKLARFPGEEWRSGPVLEAFGGRGVVRALEHAHGAVLLERLLPGTPLVDHGLDDDEATAIIATVITRLSPGAPPGTAPTVESWGTAFERCAAPDAASIPSELVAAAHATFLELCASQAATRLLHGDLHHANVLLDSRLGWVAIDPKGVVGELAYEAGAALRNPCGRPELFSTPATIRKRVDCFAHVLQLDATRILSWAFAQAVLAAIWALEDDGVLGAGTGWIAFARSARSMLSPKRMGIPGR
jgi:streptomycin 6-kinase